MKIETYRALDGWRWRIKARNGKIIAESGEAYPKRSGLKRALQSVWRQVTSTAAHNEFYRAIRELMLER